MIAHRSTVTDYS